MKSGILRGKRARWVPGKRCAVSSIVRVGLGAKNALPYSCSRPAPLRPSSLCSPVGGR